MDVREGSPVRARVRNASSADESALVAAANRGDPEAYEELYRRHSGWAISLARQLTRNEQDALDVLQEVFGYLWTKFPGFQLRSTIRAFLYPVVRHTSVDVLRRRRRDDLLADASDCGAIPWTAEGDGQSLEFRDMLEGLSADQREVVVLRFAHDFRLAEIADALGIPVGTVKSRLHNALLALRTRHRRK